MRILKKVLTYTLCAAMSISLIACGSEKGTKKRSEKEIQADAAKIGEDITCGEFVLDGKVYAFPMRLEDFIKDGWHISNNYQNVNKFELEPGELSDTFEIYKDKTKDYLTVSVFNDTDDTSTVHDCMIYTLYIDNVDFDVTYPGGLTVSSTKSEIIDSYGEGDENDDDSDKSLLYNFDGDDGWSCTVLITLSENDSIPFRSAKYMVNWSNTTGLFTDDEQCRAYFESAMKASFYGDFDDYVAAKFDTLSNAEELYQSEMEYYAEALLYYIETDSSLLEEDTYNQYVEIAKKVLAKTKWSIDNIEWDDTFNDGKITITLCPTNFFDLIEAPVGEAVEAFNTKYENVDFDSMSDEEYAKIENEYVKTVLSKIEPLVDEIVTSKEISKTYNIDDKLILTDDDWNEIDDIIMDLSED